MVLAYMAAAVQRPTLIGAAAAAVDVGLDGIVDRDLDLDLDLGVKRTKK